MREIHYVLYTNVHNLLYLRNTKDIVARTNAHIWKIHNLYFGNNLLYLILKNVVYNSIHVYYTCTIHTNLYGINHIWENAKKAGEKGRGSQKPSFSNKIQKNHEKHEK